MQPEHCKHHGADAENCFSASDMFLAFSGLYRTGWTFLTCWCAPEVLKQLNVAAHPPPRYHWADRVTKLVKCLCNVNSSDVWPLFFCPVSLFLWQLSVSHPVLQTNMAAGRLISQRGLTKGRLGGWLQVSLGFDAVCRLPIDERCLTIWTPLTYCHCLHSAQASLAVISRKANGVLPRHN